MRKWLVFLCIFFLILSFTIYSVNKSEEIVNIYGVNNAEIKTFATYDEELYGKNINLKIAETGEVIQIDIFDYLRGVVASEMPANYDIEALKAQAIVARTYMYKKIKDNAEEGADVCSSSNHCQVYKDKDEIFRLWNLVKGWSNEEIEENWSRVNTAVIETKDLVICYDDELIEAYFHASSPIKTENSDQIWSKKYCPYLVSVDSKEDEDYVNRESKVNIDYGYFEDKVKECIDENFEFTDKNVYIDSYTTSGRVNEIYVDGLLISAEKLRNMFLIKSTNFTIYTDEEGVNFDVIGYGHGVGMSQVGANYMAKNGSTYEDIIKHYYTGVEIKKNI